MRRATDPIDNFDGWLATRLSPATVDAHRRRRGEIGALQRPRLPAWLGEALGGDPWLCDLAVQILVWAGVPATAGAELWPLDGWAARRAEVTGAPPAGPDTRDTLDREVRTVLAAMGTRPKWYAEHVERPLGHKRAPVAPMPADGAAEPAPLQLVGPDEIRRRPARGPRRAGTARDRGAAGPRRRPGNGGHDGGPASVRIGRGRARPVAAQRFRARRLVGHRSRRRGPARPDRDDGLGCPRPLSPGARLKAGLPAVTSPTTGSRTTGPTASPGLPAPIATTAAAEPSSTTRRTALRDPAIARPGTVPDRCSRRRGVQDARTAPPAGSPRPVPGSRRTSARPAAPRARRAGRLRESRGRDS